MNKEKILEELQLSISNKKKAHKKSDCNWMYWVGIENTLRWILEGEENQSIESFVKSKDTNDGWVKYEEQ